jgi:hypothetical protein
MRRIYLLFTIAVLLFTACETASYPEDLTTKQVFSFQVRSSDWVSVTDQAGLNLYYRYRFNLSGITNYMINNGAVLGYIELNGAQQALPYTRHFENSNGDKWSRTVDFDYSQNDIHFYVTNNDFAVDPPETMYFRVVFIW